MNYAIVCKLLSLIMLTVAIAFGLSLGVAFLYAAEGLEKGATMGFSLSMGIALALALGLYLIGRKGENKLLRKEALFLIGIAWILASVVGAIPYILILPNCGVADAIFESTSGITTTGASVFSGLESFPRSLLFWRAISQWIGGLGVVVFFVAILSFLGAGAKILYTRESSAQSSELDYARVQSGVLRILWLYLGLSALCTVVFHFCGMSWFDAMCHMFTTIATGGFSNYSNSIGAFNNPLIEWMVILFMILGGTSFLVMLRVLRRDWKEVRQNTETTAYYLILFFASLYLTIQLLDKEHHENVMEALRAGTFQVVSLMTTTGYSTEDFAAWMPVTHSLLLALMIIGGSSGSTAGGLKVVRGLVGIKVCLVSIEKAFRPKLVRPIHINGIPLNQKAIENVITYIVLITLVGYISLVVLALFEPALTLEGTYSTIISTLYNIGPGFSEIGPTRTYAQYHDHSKYFLSLLMIMGRLELYAVMVLFVPSLWKRFY